MLLTSFFDFSLMTDMKSYLSSLISSMRLIFSFHIRSITLILSSVSLLVPFILRNCADNLPQSLDLKLRTFFICSALSFPGYLFSICSFIYIFDVPYIVLQKMMSSAITSVSLLSIPKTSVKNL